MTDDRRAQDEESCVFKLSSNKLNTNKKGSRLNVYRPPKVRPKNLTIGGRYFYG